MAYDRLSSQQYALLSEEEKKAYFDKIALEDSNKLGIGAHKIDLTGSGIEGYTQSVRERKAREQAQNDNSMDNDNQFELEKSLEQGTTEYENMVQARTPEGEKPDDAFHVQTEKSNEFASQSDEVVAEKYLGVDTESLDTPGEIFSGTCSGSYEQTTKSGKVKVAHKRMKTTGKQLAAARSIGGDKLDPRKGPRGRAMQEAEAKKATDAHIRDKQIAENAARNKILEDLNKDIQSFEDQAAIDKAKDDAMMQRMWDKRFRG